MAGAIALNEFGKYTFTTYMINRSAGEGGSFTYDSLEWWEEGRDIYFGARSPGAYLYKGRLGNETYNPIRWFSKPCTFSGFSPPAGATMGAATSSAACVYPLDYPPYRATEYNITVEFPYVPREQVEHPNTLREYNYQDDGAIHPDNRVEAPKQPRSIDEVLADLEAALESAEGAALRAELEWKLTDGEDEMVEPFRVGPYWETPPATHRNRWCERTPPGVTDVFMDPEPEKFDEQSEWSSQVGAQPMLWGTDNEKGVGGQVLPYSYIRGFGLRKIVGKHGWMPADRADTAEALMFGTVTPNHAGIAGRYKFVGPEYDPPDPSRIPAGMTVRCRRIVIVDTQARAGEPRPRGFITSYGSYTP